jgi:hypothetical protein
MVAGPAVADDPEDVFAATAAVTIPGNPLNSWDISWVDPVLGLYFLGDRTNNQVDVVDTGTNTFAGAFGTGLFKGPTPCSPPAGPNDCAGPNGVLTVNSAELWVGDGDSTVKVFDFSASQTDPPTHTISTTGKHRADELCFDPDHNMVMVANNSEDPFPFASVISTQTYTVLKKIVFDGTNGAPKATNGAEQCQYSSKTGRFYIAIPEIDGPGDNSKPGGVAVIDPGNLDVVENVFTVPLTSCVGPQGLALGPGNQALLGCNGANPSAHNPTAIINIRNGHVLATIQNESGSDEVWFNPGDGHYFLARSAAVGPSQLLGVIDAKGRRADLSAIVAPTGAPNSHSVAADPVKNQVYVPIGHDRGTVCSSAGGDDTAGCIAVFTKQSDNLASSQ